MSFLDYIKEKQSLRKLIVIGSGAVGKTSLIKVLKANKPLIEFEENFEYHRTLFLELEQIETMNGNGVFQIFDLAGQLNLPIHASRDIPRCAFGQVDLVLLFFASDNTQSLLDLQQWINLMQEYYIGVKEALPPFVLVKNKNDLENSFDESLLNILKGLEEIKNYFEISCLTGEGVEDLKNWITNYFFN